MQFVDAVRLLTITRPELAPRAPRRDHLPCFSFRKTCYKFLTLGFRGRKDGVIFELFVMFLVVANCVVMGCYSWTPPTDPIRVADTGSILDLQQTRQFYILEWLNHVFTFLFIFEMLIRIFGGGWRQYWNSNTNRLDMFINVVSLCQFVLFLVLQLTKGGSRVIANNLNIFRILRSARLLRLLRMADRIDFGKFHATRQIMETLYLAFLYSLPSVINILGLMMVIIFVYAVLGTSLFGDIDLSQDDCIYGAANLGYSEHSNFKKFQNSFSTLFFLVTGEGWVYMMRDMMVVNKRAWVYFLSYNVFVGYLFMNLILTTVVDQFEVCASML